MAEKGSIIIAIGIIIFLSHLFTSLFKKTRIPDVLFLILIGLFLGPITQLIVPEDFGKIGHVFITIALVVILFDSGLELGFKTLKKSLTGSILITFISYFFTLIVLTLVLLLTTGFTLFNAVYISAVLAGPAPALVIPIAKQMGLGEETRAKLTLESALGESLCIIISLVILEGYRLNEMNVGIITGKLLASFLLAAIIGGIGGLLWSILLNKIRELQLAIFTTPAFVFIIFGLTDILGYSGPIAVLAFGIVIGNASLINIPALKKYTTLTLAHHNEIEINFFREIVFLLKTFFFVYIGISIQFSDISSIIIALLLTITLLGSRIISVLASVDRKSTTIRDARTMASLIPKGTAAAVLGSIPFQLGIPGGETDQNIIFLVVLFSIIGTAKILFLMEKNIITSKINPIFRDFRPDDNMSEQERELEKNTDNNTF
mgnify:CR=1 FL=1